MQLNGEHLISLVITLILFLLPSLLAARKIGGAEDYSLGNRAAGAPIVSGAIVGTIIGGAATLGTAQLAFCVGLSAWWFTLGSGIGLLILALFYAYPLRQTGLSTIPQFLVAHFGKSAGPITSLASSAGIFFSIIASMLSCFGLISAILGVSSLAAAFVTVGLVCLYVFWGGIRGAAWSGLCKTGLLYLTLVVAGTTALTSLGGINGLQTAFSSDPWLSLLGQGVGLAFSNAGSLIIGIISTQTYAQAIFAARDPHTAMVGSITAATLTIPIGLPSVLVGLFMRANHPDILPLHALPLYLSNYLPAWLGGIALAALLLSAIGSIAGLALGIGSMLSGDILRELCGLHNNRLQLWANRGSILFVCLFAAHFVLHNLDSLVLDWNFLSMALRGTGIFIPLSLAILCPGKLRPAIAVCSMLAGLLASLAWLLLYPGYGNPLLPGLAGSLIVVLTGFLLTPASIID